MNPLPKLTDEQFEAFLKEDPEAKTKGITFFRTGGEYKELTARCRTEILSLRAGGKKTATRPAETPEAKAKADAAIAAHVASKAATAPVSAKAAAPAAKPAANLTAEQWRAQNAPPTLNRAEWQKLDAGDRGKFFQKGGKLID